jgi:prepilin signal peptidase PulO-like enzyme (type II secretory pathway)
MIRTEAAAVTPVNPARADVALGVAVGAVGILVIALTVPEFVAVVALPVLGAGALAVIDQRTTRIATAHAIALAVVTAAAVAIGIAVDRGSWWSVLAGAALWAVPLFLMAVAGGFGGGDFKYACSLGALAGWVSVSCSLTGLLLAVLVAALEGVALAVRRRTTRTQVPLGVPLFVGAVAAIALQAVVA